MKKTYMSNEEIRAVVTEGEEFRKEIGHALGHNCFGCQLRVNSATSYLHSVKSNKLSKPSSPALLEAMAVELDAAEAELTVSRQSAHILLQEDAGEIPEAPVQPETSLIEKVGKLASWLSY